MVGYDENNMGYRVARLPTFEVRVAIHVTFVEDYFPCRAMITRAPTLDFMTPEQSKRFTADDDTVTASLARQLTEDAARDSRGRGRPRREWQPSEAALRNIAEGPPAPPDPQDVSMMLDECIPEVWAITHSASITRSGSNSAPRTVPEALAGLDSKKWAAALHREVSQHEKNGTLGPPIPINQVPDGVKPIPLDVVLKIKRDGIYKMRAIIKGYRMSRGIDFNETFAPVPCMSSIRFLLALAAKYDLEIKQGDVSTAFLCADMDAIVYVAVPNWFRADATGREQGYTVHKLVKAIPGIPQGPRLWHLKSNKIYLDAGLTQHKSEFCVYYSLESHLIQSGGVG